MTASGALASPSAAYSAAGTARDVTIVGTGKPAHLAVRILPERLCYWKRSESRAMMGVETGVGAHEAVSERLPAMVAVLR
jgi:hypothetical protein